MYYVTLTLVSQGDLGTYFSADSSIQTLLFENVFRLIIEKGGVESWWGEGSHTHMFYSMNSNVGWTTI